MAGSFALDKEEVQSPSVSTYCQENMLAEAESLQVTDKACVPGFQDFLGLLGGCGLPLTLRLEESTTITGQLCRAVSDVSSPAM